MLSLWAAAWEVFSWPVVAVLQEKVTYHRGSRILLWPSCWWLWGAPWSIVQQRMGGVFVVIGVQAVYFFFFSLSSILWVGEQKKKAGKPSYLFVHVKERACLSRALLETKALSPLIETTTQGGNAACSPLTASASAAANNKRNGNQMDSFRCGRGPRG